MKIGVDARLLSRQISGIGRYTLQMCRALSRMGDTPLYLYSPAPVFPNVKLGLEGTIVRTKNWNNAVLRHLWFDTYLPLWAKRDEVDVFWGPAHRLPRLLPKNVARVVTIHDLVWKFAGDTMRPLPRLLERYQMPFALYAADVVVSDSEFTANSITREFGVDSEKLSVIFPGANLGQTPAPFEALQKFGIDRPYFLFVGTLEPRKNLTRLLLAYSHLTPSLKENIMLVIAGAKGWGNVSINDKVVELGLENHVVLLGYVNDSILAVLYANAQFLAMPSLYEGFGLPLVEAMAYGKPVLTANNSSMPEVVGDAGLLVDAYDSESITKCLKQIITDVDLRSRLAANAKINAARFNWDESARRLLTVFEQAISARRHRQV